MSTVAVAPPSFLKMVSVQKTKKMEQPAVVTALLQAIGI